MKRPYSPYIPGFKLVHVLPRRGRRYVCVQDGATIGNNTDIKFNKGQEITIWL